MTEQKQDYYAILGVPQTATQEDIRARYYQLAKSYHPDLQPDLAIRKLLEEEMAKITEAYKILSDPIKRAELDKKTINRKSSSNKDGKYLIYTSWCIDWRKNG